MKKILIEYANLFAYAITGIIFGCAFFLIFLNIYHYKGVNSTYIKTETDFNINTEITNKLNTIENNIKYFDNNNYNGLEDVRSLSSIQTRLNICVSKINTDELKKILDKKQINISDVYDMQEFYQMFISNECLIKQLYELSLDDNNINISSLNTIKPFLSDNIENLKNSTDYVKKVIKNNSSYYFGSDASKVDIYNELDDSYYFILNEYVKAIDFIYDVSVWFNNVAGG